MTCNGYSVILLYYYFFFSKIMEFSKVMAAAANKIMVMNNDGRENTDME